MSGAITSAETVTGDIKRFNVTRTMVDVVKSFYDHHPTPLAGSQICNFTKIKSGTVYPLLIRLNEGGWIDSHWEDIDPKIEGRPRRRFYSLTQQGFGEGHKLLSERPGITCTDDIEYAT